MEKPGPHGGFEAAPQKQTIERCDNTSVGVIVTNSLHEVALLRRAKFPIAIAPPAGHEHPHGSPEHAAIAEVYEEIGLTIAISALRRTAIQKRRVDNQCRRPGGDHHLWSVFTANEFSGQIEPSPDETRGARWYPPREVEHLAERTRRLEAGHVSQEAWNREPGLEAVWLGFFAELGYVTQ